MIRNRRVRGAWQETCTRANRNRQEERGNKTKCTQHSKNSSQSDTRDRVIDWQIKWREREKWVVHVCWRERGGSRGKKCSAHKSTSGVKINDHLHGMGIDCVCVLRRRRRTSEINADANKHSIRRKRGRRKRERKWVSSEVSHQVVQWLLCETLFSQQQNCLPKNQPSKLPLYATHDGEPLPLSFFLSFSCLHKFACSLNQLQKSLHICVLYDA